MKGDTGHAKEKEVWISVKGEKKSQKAEARRVALFLNAFRFAAFLLLPSLPGIWPLTPAPCSQPKPSLQGRAREKKEGKKDTKLVLLRKLEVCFPQNVEKIQAI